MEVVTVCLSVCKVLPLHLPGRLAYGFGLELMDFWIWNRSASHLATVTDNDTGPHDY